MAASLSLGVRRVCSYAARVNLLHNKPSSPYHTCIKPGARYHNPATFRNITERVWAKQVFRAGDHSAISVYMCQRNIFSKWRSSSRLKEEEEGKQATDNQEDKMADPQQDLDADLDDDIIPKTDETGKPLSNWARMKIMMKAYGYVVIPVHWVIAPVWFGTFYYTIKLGVDIGPLLRAISVSEHHIEYLQNSKASTALLAYALYKIFTPLRYTVTLGATELTIRKLRRIGWIRPHPPKEKTYRESLKETVGEVRDKVKERRDSKDP